MTAGEFMEMDWKCTIFATAFKSSVRDGYDSYDFVRKVMTDESIDWLYTTDDCQDWSDGLFLYSVLKSKLRFKKVDQDSEERLLDYHILYFAGYLYKYWMMNYNMDRKEAYKILPLERLVNNIITYYMHGWNYLIDNATKTYNSEKH